MPCSASAASKSFLETHASGAVDLHQIGEGSAGVDPEGSEQRLSPGIRRFARSRCGWTWERVPQVASVPPSTRRSMPVMKDARRH